MARIAGVDIPREKRVEIALTYIFGVGRTRSIQTLEATCIDRNIRVKDLTDDQLLALREHIEAAFKVEGDLRREVTADIRRKVEIGSYEGIRHRRGLPVLPPAQDHAFIRPFHRRHHSGVAAEVSDPSGSDTVAPPAVCATVSDPEGQTPILDSSNYLFDYRNHIPAGPP